jgi:type IV pilus assembly protein PilB
MNTRLTDRIREMIEPPPTSKSSAPGEDGMTFLRDSAVKMRLGITTLREINKVTFIEG